MTQRKKRNLIEGQPVLVVIDIQSGEPDPESDKTIVINYDKETTNGYTSKTPSTTWDFR